MTAGGEGLDLEAVEARAAAATPGIEGRWRVMRSAQFGRGEETEVDAARFTWSCRWAGRPDPHTREQVRRDAEFIAHARTDIPALVAEVRRLADQVEFWRSERWAAQERIRAAAAPSHANPVPLTAELLAAHGGTLPDGSYVLLEIGGVAYPMLGGRVMDPLGDRVLAESLGWVRFVVHLPGGAA